MFKPGQAAAAATNPLNTSRSFILRAEVVSGCSHLIYSKWVTNVTSPLLQIMYSVCYLFPQVSDLGHPPTDMSQRSITKHQRTYMKMKR